MEAYEIKIGLVLGKKTFQFENGIMQTENEEEAKNKTEISKNSSEKNQTEIEKTNSTHNQSINENKVGSQNLEEKISELEKDIQNQKVKLLFLEEQMLRLQKQKTLEIKEFFKKKIKNK